MNFKSLGQFISHLFSRLHIKTLASAGPNEDPWLPSLLLYKVYIV